MQREVLAAATAPAPAVLRRLDWVLMVLTAGCAVALVGLAAGGGLTETARRVLPVILGLLATSALALAGGNRFRREGPHRLGVLLILVGGVLIVVGQTVGYLLTAANPAPLDTRVYAVPQLLGLPFGAAGLALLTWRRESLGSERWVILLDSLLGLCATVIIWAQFVVPNWKASDPGAELWVMLDQAVLLVGACLVVVLSAASRRAGALSFAQTSTLLGAAGLFVVSGVVGELRWSADESTNVSYAIVGYVAAAMLIVAFLHRPVIEPDSATTAALRDTISVAIPVSLALVAALTVVSRAAVSGLAPAAVWAGAIGGVVMLASVLSARILAGRQRRKLQDDSLQQLLRGQSRGGWFEALLSGSSEFLIVIDEDTNVLFLSPAARARLRFAGDGVGQPLVAVVVDWTTPELRGMLARVATDHRAVGPYDMQLIQRDGNRCDVETTVTLARDVGFQAFVLVAQDVTAARRMETDLEYLHRRDQLTGLATWAGMVDEVEAALRAAAASDRIAFVALDISNFGVWNETLGRELGDQALRAVAMTFDALPTEVRAVARLSGDSFGWLIVSPEAAQRVTECVRIASSLMSGLILPDDREINLSFRAGYTVHRADRSVSVQRLMEEADVALRRARVSKAAALVQFRVGMNEDLMGRLAAEVALREALAESRLEVWYQPVIRLRDEAVIGLEALARIRTRDGGVTVPDAFIPVAEEVGLIGEVGALVRDQALADVVRLEGEFGVRLSVAVNVSAREVDDRLAADIAGSLDHAGLTPDRLVVEVTETVLHTQAEVSVRVLQSLRDGGVTVAVDDFGTGYSSMAALVTLPVDILKIDKSFVLAMTTSSQSAALVTTVVRLAEALSLQIVAEGVETVETADALRQLNCRWAQGFLFARPMPYEQLVGWLAMRSASQTSTSTSIAVVRAPAEPRSSADA
jgi:diguanylate cyclase (GGDEF)-like protein/PAS domain S-box-containing protein